MPGLFTWMHYAAFFKSINTTASHLTFQYLCTVDTSHTILDLDLNEFCLSGVVDTALGRNIMVKDQKGPSFLRFGGKKSENNAGARHRTGLSLSCSHVTSKLPGVSPGRQEPVEDVRAVPPASATNDSGSDRHSPSITHCRHSSAGSSITGVLATSRAEVMQTGSMGACSAPATSSSASVSPSPSPR